MKPVVQRRFVHDERPLLQNSVRTKRNIARGFALSHAFTGEKLLPIAAKEADKHHRGLKEFLRHPVKLFITASIQHIALRQGVQPRFFIVRKARKFHITSSWRQGVNRRPSGPYPE